MRARVSRVVPRPRQPGPPPSASPTPTLREVTPFRLCARCSSTIVGSAAFNLLVITAVCVLAITEGTKGIKELKVYAITASTSVLAYLWLLFILVFNSKDVVTLTESVVTFAFFWVLLFLAYAADKNFFRTASDAVAPLPRPSSRNLQPEQKEAKEKERERQQRTVRRLLLRHPQEEEAAAPKPQLSVLEDLRPSPAAGSGRWLRTARRLGATHLPPPTPSSASPPTLWLSPRARFAHAGRESPVRWTRRSG